MQKARIENRNQATSQIETKLIAVDGAYKVLVLDLSKVEGRLLYIASGADENAALDDAKDFLDAMLRGEVWQ